MFLLFLSLFFFHSNLIVWHLVSFIIKNTHFLSVFIKKKKKNYIYFFSSTKIYFTNIHLKLRKKNIHMPYIFTDVWTYFCWPWIRKKNWTEILKIFFFYILHIFFITCAYFHWLEEFFLSVLKNFPNKSLIFENFS